jgi:carbonic anhydrase
VVRVEGTRHCLAAQIEAFRTIMRHDNRPVQPLTVGQE